MDFDEALAELSAKPLDDFVAERNRLAAELRSAGDGRAAAVKALRKPSLPVWAVNRLAREHPKDFADLTAVGKRLRDAHGDLLAGGEPEAVRTLAAEERDIVASLAGHARTMLEEGGQKTSPATLERIGATLLGLATDPDAAEAAKAGRLDREVTRGGFDDAGSFEAVAPEEGRERRVSAGAKTSTARRAREAAGKSRRRADELSARADDLTRQAEDLAAEAEKLTRRAADARSSADEADKEAASAEAEAVRLENEATD